MRTNPSNHHLRDLLDKCLKLNPSERITAAEALSHPFFVELFDADEESQSLKNHLCHVDFAKIYSSTTSRNSLKKLLITELAK